MRRCASKVLLAVVMGLVVLPTPPAAATPFVLVKDGQPMCDIVVDTRGSTTSQFIHKKFGYATRDNWNKVRGTFSAWYTDYIYFQLDAAGFWLSHWP